MTPELRGELWAFLRGVLSQGGHIRDDYRGETYEAYSARLDAAARERADQFEAILARHANPTAPPTEGR